MPALIQLPGYSESELRRVEEKLVCRESQVSMLLSIFGEPQQYSYPSVFIYGHAATGKTFVTQTLLRELQVLDRAEALRDMDANLLSGFLRLQELVGGNVTVIFLSEIVWEKFRPNTGCFEPLIICFPDYSKAELQQILSLDHHPDYSADLYASFINILLGVFYSVCRDLKELRHLAALNFTKFCEPLVKGEAKESDTHRLWRNIEPHLKKAMQTVYLREISRLTVQPPQSYRVGGQRSLQASPARPQGSLVHGLSAHAHVELPYYSKFLLIAAYLASFNPARADKRFFLKVSLFMLSSCWEAVMKILCSLWFSLAGLSAHAHVELPYYSKFLLIAAYLASFNPARADKRFFLKVLNPYLKGMSLTSWETTISGTGVLISELNSTHLWDRGSDIGAKLDPSLGQGF
ncbi:UNVERIFIED_CONTAM: hypothetical protein FKN15_039007 [Acipenser sinensis]